MNLNGNLGESSSNGERPMFTNFDTWYEIGSLVGEFGTFFLFVYWLLFHKEKCPHCAAKEEIEKIRFRTLELEELEGI